MSVYSRDEMMTVAAARLLQDGQVCFVGIGLPSAACNLARLTHAPELVLIYESGTIGTRPDVLPLSIGDGNLAETAGCVIPLPEVFSFLLQAGRGDVGFLGAAQIELTWTFNFDRDIVLGVVQWSALTRVLRELVMERLVVLDCGQGAPVAVVTRAVTELAELAASVSLAGSHGARIRASLAAKADTLRGHQIAETESAAEAATERMTVPVAVLLFGFLVFIAYPAIAQITSVSGPQP